jgi:hypothetical protein
VLCWLTVASPRHSSPQHWGELIKVHRVTASPASNLDVVKRYDGLGRVIHSEEQRDGVVDAETVNDYLYDHAVNIAPQVRPINVVGKLAQAISPTGSVSFGYDLFGNINARVFTDPEGGAYVEKHTFHADGTRAALDLFLPDTGFADEHVDYRYDSAGRGRSIKTTLASFAGQDLYQSDVRDPWGRIRQAHYGPASYTASYDDVGRRLMKQVALSTSQGRSVDQLRKLRSAGPRAVALRDQERPRRGANHDNDLGLRCPRTAVVVGPGQRRQGDLHPAAGVRRPGERPHDGEHRNAG